MSSGCGDVMSLNDLQIAKKHQIFEASVTTGKQARLAVGADISYATHPVTRSPQNTPPARFRGTGAPPAPSHL
ncbi:hypothetical protein NCC02_26250, partial [Klebsiella pneumoniae]|uniref:hypothetical protein n=1 Tax=Klebsiella pneumoniae TaxID=573 RepID=UPI002F96763A